MTLGILSDGNTREGTLSEKNRLKIFKSIILKTDGREVVNSKFSDVSSMSEDYYLDLP